MMSFEVVYVIKFTLQIILPHLCSNPTAHRTNADGCGCGESNSDFSLGKAARYLYATPAGGFKTQAWELIFSSSTFLATVPTTCSRTLPSLKKRSVGML
jgi:hypothetical protein